MSGTEREFNVRQAAEELQRYLSDEIAPLMAVEYFEELVPHPPEVTAKVIAQWIQSQGQAPGDRVTMADLVFHALKKLSLLSELELVRRATMMRAIHDVSRILVQVCPEQQQADLRIRLSHLGESRTVLASRNEFLHRAPGYEGGAVAGPASGATVSGAPAAGSPAPGGPATIPPAAAPGLASVGMAASAASAASTAPSAVDSGRALSLLLAGLSKLRIRTKSGGKPTATLPETAGGKPADETAMIAQVLATAALESKTNDDLARHLDRAKTEGVATPMTEVFRTLGWSLPGWGLVGEGESAPDPRSGRHLKAMDKIVALAPDAQERAKRWGEMIYAAIEQLNEGRLAQAVSILEVAKRTIAERRPDAEIIGQVLTQAEAAISEDLLRRLADVPAKHGLLRKVLEFFPSLRPEMLLTNLDGELRREKRKLILTLIECHGAVCRNPILSRLASGMRGEYPDERGYYRRNLAYLLRRIPRSGHDRIDEECELLIAMIDPKEPLMSAKEAIGALGQLRHRQAEIALVERLRKLETDTESRGTEMERCELADRLCVALARQGSPRAIRAIVAHAYTKTPGLGDTLARFSELSRIDLSVDPEQLAALVRSIRELAPSRILAFVSKQRQHEHACVMQAVAGTPTQEVRAALEKVAEKCKGQPAGDQARRILAKLEPAAAKTPDALSGDLELFGLPNLLQSLSSSESSGEIVLFDAHQARQGSITLARGKVLRAEAGVLTAEEAVYYFMEKPFPGTFTFRSFDEPPAPGAGSKPALDPMSLLLEGARRHDEYQQARALAADNVRYEPSGTPAPRPEDEKDGRMASDVWDRAAAGMPANECEIAAKTDPYRIRRLYAFWVESGALRPVA